MNRLYRLFEMAAKWTERFLHTEGDTEETLRLKKLYVLTSAGVFIAVLSLTIATVLLQLPVLSTYGVSVLAFYMASFFVFLWVKNYAFWFYAINQTYILLATFVAILYLGGLPFSGGLLFVGLSAVIFSLALPDRKLVFWSVGLYFITLLLEGLLHPLLTPAPEMTPDINRVFFLVNSVWISAFIFLIVLYTYNLRTLTEKDKAAYIRGLYELKNQLFVNIAHEFRTPLTAIHGMAELLQAQPAQQTTERTEIILHNSDKILRLVEHILSLARLESGTMPVKNIRSNIVPFIRFVVDSYASLAQLKDISICFIPHSEVIVMDFDPDKIEELLGNILSNAIKYTPAGGQVRVTICLQTTPAEHISLSVTDTGIGIAPNEAEHIFEPYYRVQNTIQHYEIGSGIGLALVKAYLKLLNGSITLQSQLNKGSTFTITLPVLQQAEYIEQIIGYHQYPAPKPEPPAFDGIEPADDLQENLPVLLIVEDDKDIVAYLKLVLGNKYRILEASNGKDGLEQAISLIPDVVLCDVMMPLKDGYELCQTLKTDFRTDHIPVVLLTARADLNSRIASLEHGADAYLTKPFNKKELLVCLRNLLIQREKLRMKYAESTAEEYNHTTSGALNLPDAGPHGQFFQQLNDILNQNYDKESFGAEELCHQLNLSRSQAHRKMLALTGNSASHFLKLFRLKKARQLLLNTDKNISEIAYDIGFSDPNYFTRIFTHEFGISPSAFRKKQEI